MKEIMAVVRMKKTGATKKALVAAGVAGFTAVKVLGRGRLVEDPEVIEECKEKLLSMSVDDFGESGDTEEPGHQLPRRFAALPATAVHDPGA